MQKYYYYRFFTTISMRFKYFEGTPEFKTIFLCKNIYFFQYACYLMLNKIARKKKHFNFPLST